MNGVPMRFDYSKTINEQLSTFNYYKNRYCSYELQIMKLQQENQKYKEVFDKANKLIDKCIFPAYDEQSNDFQESLYKIKEVLKEVK